MNVKLFISSNHIYKMHPNKWNRKQMRRATISLYRSEEASQSSFSLQFSDKTLRLETNMQITEKGKVLYSSNEIGRSTYYNDLYLSSHMFFKLHGDQLYMLTFDDTLMAYNLDLLLQFIDNRMGSDYKPKKVATAVVLFDIDCGGELYYLTKDKSLKKHRSVYEGILKDDEGQMSTCLLKSHQHLLLASHISADNIIILRLYDAFIDFRSNLWIPAKGDENNHITNMREIRSRNVSYFLCTSYDRSLHLLACVDHVLFNLLSNVDIVDMNTVWWTEATQQGIAVFGEGQQGSGLTNLYRLKFN